MDLVCEVNHRKEWSHLPVIGKSIEPGLHLSAVASFQKFVCKAFGQAERMTNHGSPLW